MTASVSSFLRQGFPLLTKSADNMYAKTGMWVLGVGGMVVTMINVGGITRLTKSGLSMTDWSVTGSLPPMNDAEWEIEFARYKTFPEYQQRKSMDLHEFKYIYAWEYGHRMLGRLIGVVFVLPWAYFTARRLVPPGYQTRLAALCAMGATQGAVGWWMVKSGLGEDRRQDKKEIRVTPIRLTAHLTMALATYGGLFWTGLDILKLPHKDLVADQILKAKDAMRYAARLRTGFIHLTALTCVTIVSGALVAGNDAGRAYNTYPKMGDQWIPDEIWDLEPFHRNFIENTALVQFNHRVLATTTASAAVVLAGVGLLSPNKAALVTPQVRKGLLAVGLAATGQFALGITTLLSYVPIGLAAAHQLGSIVVFTSCVYLVHSLQYARPAIVRSALRTVHGKANMVATSVKPMA
jgi:cytochrome c oxidase assembly protein subunit 15